MTYLHFNPHFSYLLPEKNKSVKQKTPVVKRNCNPEWNHIFLFDNISMEELANRSLELTVWDYDRITSNDFLGGVRLNLGTGNSQYRNDFLGGVRLNLRTGSSLCRNNNIKLLKSRQNVLSCHRYIW